MKPREPKQDQGDLTQSERFKQAARELGTDEDPERFKEMVRKVAKRPGPSDVKAASSPKRASR